MVSARISWVLVGIGPAQRSPPSPPPLVSSPECHLRLCARSLAPASGPLQPQLAHDAFLNNSPAHHDRLPPIFSVKRPSLSRAGASEAVSPRESQSKEDHDCLWNFPESPDACAPRSGSLAGGEAVAVGLK